jgi:hypothetical protein
LPPKTRVRQETVHYPAEEFGQRKHQRPKGARIEAEALNHACRSKRIADLAETVCHQATPATTRRSVSTKLCKLE